MNQDDEITKICPHPELGSLVDEIEKESEEQVERLGEIFDEVGSRENKYLDKKFIAAGGMKNISSVKDKSSLRTVALAELKGDYSESQIINFYNEARITAQLEHPNIVPVYEISHEEGEPYFTMKEIHGDNLGEIIKGLTKGDPELQKKYSLNALLNIFIKVCDAIAFAHSKNIVHLDLKPDNIHVGEFGEVLVIDWGLAKNLNEDVSDDSESISSEIDLEHTLDGYVKGTIGYMAPEQARGENKEKDKQTDIYSLGAILYCILDYNAPYEHEDIKMALALISQSEYTPLGTGKYPAALTAVVHKAMELKKSDRYESVEGLKEEIQRYLDGFATEAQQADFSILLKLFIKRNKFTLGLVTLFLIILISTSILFIQQLKENERIAQNNAIEAQENEKKALALYNDLLKANEEKQELTELSIPLAKNLCGHHSYNMRFDEAYDVMSKVSKQEIPDHFYWINYAQLQLGRLELQKAVNSFQNAIKHAENNKAKIKSARERMELCKKYPTDLSLDDVLNLIKELDRSMEHSGSMVSHICSTVYNKWDISDKERAEFLRKALIIVNPQVKELKFSYEDDNGNGRLDLSDNSQLSYLYPLTHFPAKTLLLRNCHNLESFRYLRENNISRFDLSGSKAKNFGHIAALGLFYLNFQDVDIRSFDIQRSPLKYANFAGCNIDMRDVRDPKIENLNLCRAKIRNFDNLSGFHRLYSLVIPESFKLTLDQKEFLQKKKVKVTYCKCREKSECKFKKFE